MCLLMKLIHNYNLGVAPLSLSPSLLSFFILKWAGQSQWSRPHPRVEKTLMPCTNSTRKDSISFLKSTKQTMASQMTSTLHSSSAVPSWPVRSLTYSSPLLSSRENICYLVPSFPLGLLDSCLCYIQHTSNAVITASINHCVRGKAIMFKYHNALSKHTS